MSPPRSITELALLAARSPASASLPIWLSICLPTGPPRHDLSGFDVGRNCGAPPRSSRKSIFPHENEPFDQWVLPSVGEEAMSRDPPIYPALGGARLRLARERDKEEERAPAAN